MEKLTRFIPLAFFSASFLKVIILGGSSNDVFVMAILAVMCMYAEYKAKDKQLMAVEAAINSAKADLEQHKKEIESLKSTVTAVKMGQMRGVSVGR